MSDLTQLGAKVVAASAPDFSVLETIAVPASMGAHTAIRLSCPEFTSLCPVTGQPDFARIYIDYVPNLKLVESKSLKLFMVSFRNHGDFHEAVTNYIGHRLVKALEPRWLRISAIWYPRGGIPIDVFWQTGPFPQNYHLPRLRNFDFEGR